MALPRIIPALADLTQDTAGPVPLELLRRWADGTQDVTTARELLNGFRIRGIVAVTDSSGLSKLADEQDLLHVLALISAPKAIVHGFGVELGGRAIGTWVADNSRMYYPESAAIDEVAVAMAEAQRRVAEDGHPAIGVCVHKGEFFEIGGGLYGPDAELVESLGEHHARGGELLVTSTVADALRGGCGFDLQVRPDLTESYGSPVFTLRTARRLPRTGARSTTYPHPFPPDVFALLSADAEDAHIDQAKQEIYARYLRERVVVFLWVVHEVVEDGLAGLLDALVVNALMETVLRRAVGTADHIASIGGGIAILTFESAQEALDSALSIRARLLENAIMTKIGIEQGPALLFSNARGRSGIAGAPVNIASKISEDTAAEGHIQLTSRVAKRLSNLPPSRPFQITVSGITLEGISL